MTVENLRLIKAYKTAIILEKALDQVNVEKYNIDELREKVFNRKDEKIADFEEELLGFLDILDSEYDDLGQLFIDYLEFNNINM